MKKRIQSVFYCKNCGNEFPKWMGKCDYCNEWNTIIEKKVSDNKNATTFSKASANPTLLKLSEVTANEGVRFFFQDEEFNRIMGGGLMAGSISLVAGEPGIGKSTLFLQLSLNEKKKLYMSVVKRALNKSKNAPIA